MYQLQLIVILIHGIISIRISTKIPIKPTNWIRNAARLLPFFRSDTDMPNATPQYIGAAAITNERTRAKNSIVGPASYCALVIAAMNSIKIDRTK